MRLKKLLDRYMYKDTATIYRCDEAPDGPVDDYEEVMVYENIPCKLSQYGKDLNFKATDMAPEVNENLRMTCNPAYDIQPNAKPASLLSHSNPKPALLLSSSIQKPPPASEGAVEK